MDYLKLLERSYELSLHNECPPQNRLDFLGEAVFGFTTYDSGPNALFAKKAVEACEAINNKATFDYIKDPDNYQWYLLMVNMPFFSNRLEWGTSIRGAWWNYYGETQSLESCSLFDEDGGQILTIDFVEDEWGKFIAAMVEFAATQPKEGPGV